MVPIIEQIDRSIFFYFQGLKHSWWDYVLTWPTAFGDALFALSLIVFGILIFDKTPFKSQRALVAVTSILLTNGVVHLLKFLFNRPRPFLFWENIEVLFVKPISAAFPSGHAAIIFSVAFLLNHFYPRRMLWVYPVAIWVSLTRVYIGVHYPSDIVAGAILGIVCTCLTYRSWNSNQHKLQNKGINL